MSEKHQGLGRVLAVVCLGLILVTIFACIFGTKINCFDNEAIIIANRPKMIHYPNIIKNTKLGALSDTKAKASMKTIAYSMVANLQMSGGLFKFEPGPGLEFTQWYEGILVVLSGSVKITAPGQSFTAKGKDSFYIPLGTKVKYEATKTSYLYYVARIPDPTKMAAIQTASVATNKPKITRAMNFDTAKPSLPLFVDKTIPKGVAQSLSYLNDTLMSADKKTGKIVGGLYKLLKGPALKYTYTYEEFKYIVEGEFHLTDGTGQKVVAKGGDLMYFPKGTYVVFTSTNHALGFFVGQRASGAA